MAARTRTTTFVLSIALLAGAAGLAPVASAAPGAGGELTAPDRALAEQVRERARALLAEEAATSGALASELSGGSTVQQDVMNPIVTRTDGSNRYAVAANLATTYWTLFWDESSEPLPEDYEKVVFVASGEIFSDALSGGAAAAYWGGPVLLTYKDRLPQVTKDALTALQPDVVVVLGGTNTVYGAVATELEDYVGAGGYVDRVDGADRYHVSANLAGTIGWSPRAYVATGLNWPDGLAGGAAAGAEWAPLLLTKKTDVPDVVMETLANVTQPEEIVVLGGSNTIDDAVLRELETIAPVTRIGGADRYAVAANVADLHPTTYGATMATGLNWPDALAGSAFAGLVGDKMLLLKPTVVPADTRQAILDHSLVLIDLLGGTTSVPQAVVDDLEAMEVVVPEP